MKLVETKKINTDIMCDMVREYFSQKINQPMELWNSYSISIDAYYFETDKIFLQYKIAIRKGEKPNTHFVRIDRGDYERRLSRIESNERDKKLEKILRPPTLLEKIRNKF
jgi:hypothetical protein